VRGAPRVPQVVAAASLRLAPSQLGARAVGGGATRNTLPDACGGKSAPASAVESRSPARLFPGHSHKGSWSEARREWAPSFFRDDQGANESATHRDAPTVSPTTPRARSSRSRPPAHLANGSTLVSGVGEPGNDGEQGIVFIQVAVLSVCMAVGVVLVLVAVTRARALTTTGARARLRRAQGSRFSTRPSRSAAGWAALGEIGGASDSRGRRFRAPGATRSAAARPPRPPGAIAGANDRASRVTRSDGSSQDGRLGGELSAEIADLRQALHDPPEPWVQLRARALRVRVSASRSPAQTGPTPPQVDPFGLDGEVG
jgi:hypothetical protein